MMNAVVALCHFCEVHGPAAIFCTQTLREAKWRQLEVEQQCQQQANKTCPACSSIGQENSFYSAENGSGITFLSSEIAALGEVSSLVAEAAIRSLSCEISCSENGGFVFFGDSTRGHHVLSHTFQISDLLARGFNQLFSIIVLTKDQYFLLNTKPFLAHHLKRISTEIKEIALSSNGSDGTKHSIAQQRRLSHSPILVTTPRSLVDLTGEANIFHILHSHFAWLLEVGSRYLTENATFVNLPWSSPQLICSASSQQLLPSKITFPVRSKDESSLNYTSPDTNSLRTLKKLLCKEFAALCYCALTGINIIIRGFPKRTLNFMFCLRKLLPKEMHKLICNDVQYQHSVNFEYKIITVSPNIDVCTKDGLVFLIDFVEGVDDLREPCVKWSGQLPNKWPQLLSALIKAVDEPRLTDLVLSKRAQVLIEEWKNKVICLQCTSSAHNLSKLQKVLGVQPQDQHLIEYWGSYLKSQIK